MMRAGAVDGEAEQVIDDPAAASIPVDIPASSRTSTTAAPDIYMQTRAGVLGMQLGGMGRRRGLVVDKVATCRVSRQPSGC
jgi:hypothetical protein